MNRTTIPEPHAMQALVAHSPGEAPAFAEAPARWAALAARDPAADGHFVYAVRSTGVYCRPSCAARAPRRENVSFHPTCEAAEAAGFRACLRCRPNAPSRAARDAEMVARACRRIGEAEEPPTLEILAREAGMSPFHFHRVFRRCAGMTPRTYAQARRAERLGADLAGAETVTRAIYAAGYASASRFYATAPARLGMSPSAYRKGGAGTRIRFAVGQCSLGAILVAATDRGVCAILLGDDPEALVRDLQDRFSQAEILGAEPAFEAVVAQAVGLVEAPGAPHALPLDIGGTAFQQRVWDALRAIPPGRTATYTQIAGAIGQPSAARAVALACGANAHAVAIPCHRVVRHDGSLSGYRWGVERKAELLVREGARAPQAGAAENGVTL